MCGHLMTAGYEAVVFNRSPEKTKALVARGRNSPRRRAGRRGERRDFHDRRLPGDVRDVTLGPDGTLAGAAAGSVLVDMTTSEPSLAREIFEASRLKGVYAVDAPVSGGDIGGARHGSRSWSAGKPRSSPL